MSKRLAALIAVSILPAVAVVPGAQARGINLSALRHAEVSNRPQRVVQAPLRLSTGPVPGGTFTAGAEAQPIGTLPQVRVGNTPQNAVFDPATQTVYVANQGDNTVSVVDARKCNANDTSGCGQAPPTVAAGSGPAFAAIDDATHTLYVTDSSSDTVSVINTATCNAQDARGCGQTPATLTVGNGPGGLAVDAATDTVYVANQGDNTLSVIDGATCNASNTSGCGHAPPTVTVGQLPFFATLDPTNHTLYVSNALDDTVSMIDAATCNAQNTSGCSQTPPTAAVGGFPIPIAVDPQTDTVYVGNNNDATVSVIDGASCNATNTAGCGGSPVTVSVPGGPDGMAFNRTTDTLFVANNGPGSSTARANSVSVINAATCDANTTVGCDQRAPTALTGANPGGATIDQATDTLFVTTFDNTLQLINGATCNATIATGCGQTTPATVAGNLPVSVAINQQTNTAYVGDSSEFEGLSPSWMISVLDTATCNTLDSGGCTPNPPAITTQLNPYAVAVDQTTDTLYATNLQDVNRNPGDSVSVIDGAICNASVTSGCSNTPPTVTVGNNPFGVAIDQSTDTIYVANAGDNTLSVIDGRTCNAINSSGCNQTPVKVPLVSNPHYGPTAVAVNQATDTVYVLNQGTPGVVSVLNGATCNASVTTGCHKKPPTVTVGNASGPAGVAVDEITNTVYVDNTADDTVSVINGTACDGSNTSDCGQTPPHVAVGRQSFGYVAVDPSTNLVYVTDSLDDAVSIIDGATCNANHTGGCEQTPPTVPVGPSPTGVAVDQHNHNVYVTDNGGGPVSFFQFQAPGTPTNVTASTSNAETKVGWRPPYDGGLPIIYKVNPEPACPACTGLTTPSTSGIPSTTIGGLTRGQTYTFEVRATDAAGTGPASAPSNPVIP